MKRFVLAMAGARPLAILLAGLGAGLTIYVLLLLHDTTKLALLVPSFGASCALVFGVPGSPFARPLSVIGGHLVASAMGLIVLAVLGHGAAAMAVGVGLGIAAMLATRTMHPPAGGDPLIVIAVGATPWFLLTPILAGTVVIVALGYAYRRTIARSG
ncbi:MAG: HPP family protein [Sphingomicrobium sp.]